VVGSFEHGNEPSGSIKGGESIDYLNDRKGKQAHFVEHLCSL